LVSNAVQHGDQTSEIVVSATTDGAQVRLSVHNEGPPIPEVLLPHIFEPLVRGANCGPRNGSTGLGLYIAQEVARAHGGGIAVTSTASAGTTFTVTLPVRCRVRATERAASCSRAVAALG
jgi:signal transduction histidine kinase